MSEYTDHINKHYSLPNLIESFKDKTLSSGKSIDTLIPDDISGFDELHVGGHNFSNNLFDKLNLLKNTRVLDCGSGLGGPARLLNKKFRVNVTGIDMTTDFSVIAHHLSSALDNKSGSTQFITGNALNLPFRDSLFHTILNQHFCMNIPDKVTLYREMSRVIVPGGTFVVHEIFKGDNNALHYPVPWARNDSLSHLISFDQFEYLLQENKFQKTYCKDISMESLDWYQDLKKHKKKPSSLNQFLIFGNDLKKMAVNMQHNLRERQIKIIQAVYKKKQ